MDPVQRMRLSPQAVAIAMQRQRLAGDGQLPSPRTHHMDAVKAGASLTSARHAYADRPVGGVP